MAEQCEYVGPSSAICGGQMRALVSFPIVAVLSVSVSSSVLARIVCHDQFQVIEGHEIATPYCQDDNLARVARENGRNVSAAEVRNNSALRNQLCKTLGDDISVRTTCTGTRTGSTPAAPFAAVLA